MARHKETQKVKGKFSSLKAVRWVTSLLRKTGSSQEKPKKRRATSAHSQEKLNKWKKETMMQAVQEYRSSRMPVIGTVYHNYHRPALIILFIFPDLLPKILRTSSQERACPTWTYACLVKHYSK